MANPRPLPHGLSVHVSLDDTHVNWLTSPEGYEEAIAINNTSYIGNINDAIVESPHFTTNEQSTIDNETVVSPPASEENVGSLTTSTISMAYSPGKPISAHTFEKTATNVAKALVRAQKLASQKVKLGTSPFPKHRRPTRTEAYKVHHILSTAHGFFEQPPSPPMPSATVAGCGEVPFIIEALMRTIISANTTMAKANAAIRGLLSRYRVYGTGPYAGSVDWNQVRLDLHSNLSEAIRPGGINADKARYIQDSLQMIWEQNHKKRLQLIACGGITVDSQNSRQHSTGTYSNTKSHRITTLIQTSNKTLLEHPHILTLDYMHAYSDEEAFNALQSYPGVGPKVAACVLLFCMHRPVFPVDTHCYRLCQWLGWVPNWRMDREKVFAHVDARLPNELKYSLHQLMIVHGQECQRCNAKDLVLDDETDPLCPLERLLDRKRKGSNTIKIDRARKMKLLAAAKRRTKAGLVKKLVVKSVVEDRESEDGEEDEEPPEDEEQGFVPLVDTQMLGFDLEMVKDDFDESGLSAADDDKADTDWI